MKALIAPAVSLLVGLVAGCYIGYGYYEKHLTNEAAEQMVQEVESSDRLEAANAVRAIGLIESGETQKAVQLLSRPLVDYYYIYAIHAGTNDGQAERLRAQIEQLAGSNQVVATEITNQMSNFEVHGKIR
jgi:uncharacterized protein (UPF0261 family)